MWKIIIEMPGDEPAEADVEDIEKRISDLLDRFDIPWLDVSAE